MKSCIQRSLNIYKNFVFHIALLCCLLIVAPQMGEAQLRSERQAGVSISRRNAIVNAIEYASPAVVNISTTRTTTQMVNMSPFFDDWAPFFDFPFQVPQRRTLHGLGSGVIFDRKGYVITNQHVIKGADSTTVLLSDGREASAEIVGEDFLTDLAVLKIDIPALKAIELGNAKDLMIGRSGRLQLDILLRRWLRMQVLLSLLAW